MIGKLFDILVRGGGDGPEPPSLDSILASADRHLDNFDSLIPSAPESKPRTSFNADIPKSEMSMLNTTPVQKLKFLSRGLPLFLNMQKSARMYDGTYQPTRDEASPEFLDELETTAFEAGASDVAYVEIPDNAIFEGKGIPHRYAIVFTVEMDKEPIDTSPSFESQYEVVRGYKNLAVIGNRLARKMRREGFAAYPGTALGGITDYVHLAELAGLGAIGYHGLLISPHDGARLRINTIYTNITNLPIRDPSDNEHLWVRDFCSMCKKCVRSCPVDAIYDQPKPRGDGGMQSIDHATCRNYFAANFGCAVCLKVCPFSQVGYDKIAAGFRGNPDAPQFRIPLTTVADAPPAT